MRHPPHLPLTLSYVLDEFLTMLHNRRINYPLTTKQKKEVSRDDLHYIKFRLEGAQTAVADQVFGPLKAVVPPAAVD